MQISISEERRKKIIDDRNRKRKSFSDEGSRTIAQLLGDSVFQERETMNNNGFNVFKETHYVIKALGREIKLDRDEALFLMNELRTMLSDSRDNKEEEND